MIQFPKRAVTRAGLVLVCAAPALAAQQKCPATTPGTKMPLTYKGGATVPAITACDLMTRLYIYAADSMRGREAGSPDAIRATAYIEREVRRLGLKPAGDNGTYFQYLPVTARSVAKTSTISAGGRTFHMGTDFTVAGANADRNVSGDAIFGGTLGDTTNALSAAEVQGKVVIMKAGAAGAGRGGFGGGRGRGGANNPLAGAAAIVTVATALTPPRAQYTLNDTVQNEGREAYAAANPAAAAGGRGGRGGRGFGGGGNALNLTVTPRVAMAMLGKPTDAAAKGDKGGAVTIDVKVQTVAAPTRNVLGIIPGTDPVLKNEYIVIGAHSDHIGLSSARPIAEHDSLKAYNIIARVEGADSRGAPPPTEEQWARINALKDSLRKVYPPRLDSISNGADDDGSGSVSILEIAEA
ncbi:MAG: M28 family peptidase, partial [Gemmatimonadaceae bacterium]